MELSLADIAERLGGQIVGDGNLLIRGVATLDDAASGDISFLFNPRYTSRAKVTAASAIVVKEYLPGARAALLLVPDPQYAFACLLSIFYPPKPQPTGIDPSAVIGRGVFLGEEVTVGPCAVVEEGATIRRGVRIGAGTFIGAGSEVGEETLIYPNVTIYKGVKMGRRVIIQSGCVIGSDGFGFVPHQGRHIKVPQVGGVMIEDDVEVGANVTIDRATLGWTVIGRGTKINNMVQIGHNVTIGADCILVAQVGISGSVRIGNRVTLAGQVGVAGHLEIGDQSVVAARSGVTRDLPPRSRVSGFPAMEHNVWRKSTATFSHLPEMRKKIGALQKQIDQMTRRLALLEGSTT